jgi:hypothetical protein
LDKKFRFILLFLFLYPGILKAQESLVCNKGVLDLSNYNYLSDYTIKLNGEWLFSKSKFETEINELGNAKFIKVPGSWNFNKFDWLNSGQLGYCTYSLKIILPQNEKLWSLHLPPIHSAYKIFINNALIAQVGNPTSGKNMSPAVLTQVVTFFS